MSLLLCLLFFCALDADVVGGAAVVDCLVCVRGLCLLLFMCVALAIAVLVVAGCCYCACRCCICLRLLLLLQCCYR